MTKYNIAIATENVYSPPNLPWNDDLLLKEELERRGHNVFIIDWQNPDVNLEFFNTIFISTTWSIPYYSDKFIVWINDCEKDGKKRLINSKKVINFGLFKDVYLLYFKEKFKNTKMSNSLIPSHFILSKNLNKQFSLNKILESLDNSTEWLNNNIVIKPIIAADGIKTFVYNRNNSAINIKKEYLLTEAKQAQKECLNILEVKNLRGVILQPYLAGIEEGEYSLTYINGERILNVKKAGGFRNDLFKNRSIVEEVQLPLSIKNLADDILKKLLEKFNRSDLIRLRIDIIQDCGIAKLSEVELIEPNCNFSVIKNTNNNCSIEFLISQLATAIEEKNNNYVSIQ